MQKNENVLKHLLCAILRIPVVSVTSLEIKNPRYHNHYTDGFGIITLNLLQIQNGRVVEQERDTQLYQWAQVFKADSWEEIVMLAQKNEAIDECVYTMAQLSEDEKIRMQCEARKDQIAIEKGLYSRGLRQGRQEGHQKGRQEGIKLAKSVICLEKEGYTISDIATELQINEEEVKKILES